MIDNASGDLVKYCMNLEQELAATKQKLVAAEQDLAQHKEMLRQEMVETNKAHSRAEAAEQAIRESQEQGSVVWMQSTHLDKFIHKACGADSMLAKSSGRKLMSDYIPLYTKPVIILQSAEQLHIKELRDDVAKLRYMIYMGATTAALFDIADKALAKQPDTRALDKALLEVEIKVLCEAYDSCKPYGVEFLYMMTERNEKLAELNKEQS